MDLEKEIPSTPDQQLELRQVLQGYRSTGNLDRREVQSRCSNRNSNTHLCDRGSIWWWMESWQEISASYRPFKIDIGSPWAELLHRPSKVLLGPTRPQHTSSRPSLAGTKESNPDILLGRANKNKIRQKKVLRDGLVQAEDLVDLIGALGQTPIFTNEWFW